MTEQMHILKRTPINKEQYTRLIEMCEYFFEGYNFMDKWEDNTMYVMWSEGRDGKVDSMSWFELCITDLNIKVSQLADIDAYHQMEKWFYGNSYEHVVDYLFKIYKEHS